MPVIPIVVGAVAVATAFGLMQIRWSIESVEKIADKPVAWGGVAAVGLFGLAALIFVWRR